VPLKWLWLPIAKVQNGLGGKTKAIISSIAAAAVLLLAAMIFVPYPLKLDANGQLLPKERQRLYPPHQGKIEKFLIMPNDQFDPGHHIAVLYDQDLEAQLRKLDDEAKTAAIQAQNVEMQISTATKDPYKLGQLYAERDKQLSIFRGKSAERDDMMRANNCAPGRPGYFYLQAPKFTGTQATGRMPVWTVLDADFREVFQNKFVRPNEPLIRLGDKGGAWELELKIPQKHINQVLKAFDSKETDPKLFVDILVTSRPTEIYQGVLYKSHISGEAVPNKDDHNETNPVVIAYVTLDDPAIPDDSRLPRDLLVAGVEVHTKVRGQNHAMGYSLFYGLWEFIYEKVVFFF
jgi:hypothetical protein